MTTPTPPADSTNQNQLDQEQLVFFLSGPAGTVALDASTGHELWRAEIPLDGMAVAGAYLLGMDQSNLSTYHDRLRATRLHCLDRATGKHLWTYSEPILTHNWKSLPLLLATPTTAYCMTSSHDIVALRPSDGIPLWQRAYPDWDLERVLEAPDNLIVLEARERGVDGMTRRAGAAMIGALDVHDGEQRWLHQWDASFSGFDDRLSPLMLDQSGVFYRIDGDTVVARELADGAIRWQFLLSAPVDSLALAQPGALAVGTNGYVFALNTTDGSIRWRYCDSRSDIYVSQYLDDQVILHVPYLARVADQLLVAIEYIAEYDKRTDPGIEGLLVTLSASDGILLWRTGTGPGTTPSSLQILLLLSLALYRRLSTHRR